MLTLRLVTSYFINQNHILLILIRILLITVMFRRITPAHPPRRSLQQALTSIHNGRSIHLLPCHLIRELMICRVDPGDVAVNINALPVTLGNVVGLVVDAHVWILLDILVPPVPTWAMVLGMSELMQAFH